MVRRAREHDTWEVMRWSGMVGLVKPEDVAELPKPHHEAELEDLLKHGPQPDIEVEDFFDPAEGPLESRVISWEEVRARASERARTEGELEDPEAPDG